MTARDREQLQGFVKELSGIAEELNDISRGVKSSFKNIGNEQCAKVIDRAIDDCKRARGRLQNMRFNQEGDRRGPSHID